MRPFAAPLQPYARLVPDFSVFKLHSIIPSYTPPLSLYIPTWHDNPCIFQQRLMQVTLIPRRHKHDIHVQHLFPLFPALFFRKV
jgi:hypothetical protein